MDNFDVIKEINKSEVEYKQKKKKKSTFRLSLNIAIIIIALILGVGYFSVEKMKLERDNTDDFLIPIPTVNTDFTINYDGTILIRGLAKIYDNTDSVILSNYIICTRNSCISGGAALELETVPGLGVDITTNPIITDYEIIEKDNNHILAKAKEYNRIFYIYIDIKNQTVYKTIEFLNSPDNMKIQILTNPDEVKAELKRIFKQYMSNK